MASIPPTLALPHKGGGNTAPGDMISPSPVMGEGWGGGGAIGTKRRL